MAWIFIAKVDSDISPTKNLREYIKEANLVDQQEYLFRAIELKCSNFVFNNTINDFIVSERWNPKKLFGTHSLRRGGSTFAENNGVNDRSTEGGNLLAQRSDI